MAVGVEASISQRVTGAPEPNPCFVDRVRILREGPMRWKLVCPDSRKPSRPPACAAEPVDVRTAKKECLQIKRVLGPTVGVVNGHPTSKGLSIDTPGPGVLVHGVFHVRWYLQCGMLCFCKWARLQATGYDLGTLHA